LTGLAGDVLEQGVNPVVDISVSYEGDLEYKADDDLRIEVLSVLESETVEIVLPPNYEILGDFGTKAEFPSGNTSRLVVKEPLEVNAKVKKAPEAKLTFKDSNKYYRVEPKKFIVKVDSNVTLTGKDSKDPVGKIVEYNWDLPSSVTLLEGSKVGDKESAEQIIFQFSAHSDSYYNITLWVKDSSGLVSKKDWIELMPDAKAPTLDTYTLYNTVKKVFLEAPYEIDEDVLVELNASTSEDKGVIADHLWSFNDGSGALNGEVVKHRFADPGTYNISLTIRDTAGNELKLDNRTITVKDMTKPLPVFVLSPTDIKIGTKVKLNASQSYDPRTTGKLYDALVNYTWQMYKVGKNYTSQQRIGSGKVLEYTFSQPGNWVVNLTVTDKAGLLGWYEKTIFVGGPDLQVEAITFVKPEQTKLREGDKAKISIRIKNNGLVDTHKNTTWYVKITMNGKIIKNETVNVVIGHGKTFYTNITYELKKKGSKEFEVILDPTDKVMESEENNNKLKTKVTVKEAEPWFEWWYALILVGVILVVYVVFMRVSRSQWGYEPIVELWKKYMG
jgi:PKD repeat protein